MGFDVGSERFEAAVDLSRITFCYIAFISLVALYSGILNSLGQFAVAAAAPIILNICMIVGMVASYVWLEATATSLAWSVAIAGVLQFFWLRAAASRQGMAPAFRRPRITPEVKRLFGLILPGVFGASVAQISLLADVFFRLFPEGRLDLLPLLCRPRRPAAARRHRCRGRHGAPAADGASVARGETEAAAHSQNRGIELALLLTIPAAIASRCSACRSSRCCSSAGRSARSKASPPAPPFRPMRSGLPAYVLIKVLAPGFFAREDTRTPVQIAVVCLAANVVFVLLLIGPLQHVGIALATVLSSWLNAVLLGWMLYRRGLFRLDDRLKHRLPRIVVAGIAMALVVCSPWARLPGSCLRSWH